MVDIKENTGRDIVETWLFLGMMEDKVYCKYEGEHSQRRLEGSRLNMTD